MASDAFTRDRPPKFLANSMLKSSLLRQMNSATNQGNDLQSVVKAMHAPRTISRSSTILTPTGSDDHGYTPPTQPRTINVVLFGETGVGKSSVINLIAQREIARVSSDVDVTMQSTRYDIPFDGMNFAIFDTIGLEEPQMGVNDYLKAIQKVYELITKLSAAGGIHLLLLCMRGGRITATTQSNYRLFCECLCSTKVPIAFVFTGRDREVEMAGWWMRNKTHIEHYGLKSDDHACIIAVQGDTSEECLQYMQSQKRMHELLKTRGLKNEAFSPEPLAWLAKVGRGMRSFIAKDRNPKKRDVTRVLTHRCALDPEIAKKIAEMMEKGNVETKEGSQDEVDKEEPNLASEVAKDVGETDARGDIEAVPRKPDILLETVEEDVEELDAQSQQQSDIQNVPCNAVKGQAVKKGSAWSCQGCAL